MTFLPPLPEGQQFPDGIAESLRAAARCKKLAALIVLRCPFRRPHSPHA